jgi:hypothetical protein
VRRIPYGRNLDFLDRRLSYMNTKKVLEFRDSLKRELKTYVPNVLYEPQTKLNKLRGLSPRANYTDRATAACRLS